jgi:hypothetical protein
MSGSKRYVLDANVFISAKNTYYAFDVCPGFWRALIAHHENRRVFSIDRVLDELLEERDELSDWVKDTAPESFFKKTQDVSVINIFQKMAAWVNSQPQFTSAAKSDFATAADGWLLAYAKANGLTVVTHEEFAPEVKRKVPIPNVCLEFDIHYANTFEMLKDLNVRLVLSTKTQRRK